MFTLLDNYKALVYVDSDARFRKFPILFYEYAESEIEFAVHYRKGLELLSGTIYMKRTHLTYDILKTWESVANNNPTKWDQKVLQSIMPRYQKEKYIGELPMEYCKIFDAVDMNCDPVIEHLQASRKMKPLINGRKK